MQIFNVFVVLATVIVSVSANSPSFGGANNYFIHAASSSEQNNWVNTLSSWGAKVVRLWVVGSGGGCVKGSKTEWVENLEDSGSIGTYHDDVLHRLDNTLSLLYKKGIKAIISPHDGGSLGGANGCDTYCNKYHNSDNFYSNNTAKADYDKRLAHILNYHSPNFNKPWSQLHEVILAFDIQNEPMINSVGKLQNNDPDDWICGRAGNMKKIINGSGVKIATGGIGGSEYCCDHEFNIIPKALYCSAIDILSVHGYMASASQWAYFIPKLEQEAAAQGKHLMIEEWGVKKDPAGQFDDQVKVFNNAGVPWLYWQVIPGKDQSQSCSGECCYNNNGNSYDEFEIGLSSSKGDVQGAMHVAAQKTGAQDWAGFVY